MSFTLTTSGQAIIKAGLYANSTITNSNSILSSFSDMIEGRICSETKRDWVTNFASINTQIKGLLNDIASDGIAMEIIAYDTQTQISRGIETMLDRLTNKWINGIRVLNELTSDQIRSVV